MTTALYPGSFDPITLGHVDIVERAAHLFEQVIIAVFDKPLKNLTFSPETRHQLAEVALAHLDNVTVVPYSGLTVNFARKMQAQVIIRGLRSAIDLEKEMQLAMANRYLAPNIDTICLMTSQEYAFISSSLIKEIAINGGDVSQLVPPHVLMSLKEKYSLT